VDTVCHCVVEKKEKKQKTNKHKTHKTQKGNAGMLCAQPSSKVKDESVDGGNLAPFHEIARSDSIV
jgi:hypothetical protein